MTDAQIQSRADQIAAMRRDFKAIWEHQRVILKRDWRLDKKAIQAAEVSAWLMFLEAFKIANHRPPGELPPNQ